MFLRKSKTVLFVLLVFVAAVFLLWSCELFNYGKLGGADLTGTYYPGDVVFTERMDFLSDVWYSHYAGIGRLDGYRIGKWSDFDELVEDAGKRALFPDLEGETYTGSAITANDYFLLYDGSVYGQSDEGIGGSHPGGSNFDYCGIVRAINVFNGDMKRGAVIIEYLKGSAPQWDSDIKDGQLPFFGIYYRVLSDDVVQMANAVDLVAMYAFEPYYTEKETLEEAIEANSVENEAEFISWGVVIPQDREEQ